MFLHYLNRVGINWSDLKNVLYIDRLRKTGQFLSIHLKLLSNQICDIRYRKQTSLELGDHCMGHAGH